MNHYGSFAAALCALALASAIDLRADRSASPSQPNIVFILTDDQRWDALGIEENSLAITPNIDRLAEQGVRFSNHYVTTSICAVSRASIFSGQYQRRHGISNFSAVFTPKQWAETYPGLLRENGYRTGFIGKYGVGKPESVAAMEPAFDYWKGVPGQGGKYFIDPEDPTKTHETARFGNQALEFLETSPKDQPFCLSISFSAPHARDGQPYPHTYRPDERDRGLYSEGELPHPPTATPEYHGKLPASVQKSVARQRWKMRFGTEDLYQKNGKDYYRLVAGIDREVGRIREALEERGVAHNTLIVFTSDNGYALGDRGLSGKWFMYQESMRVPLIIFDPRLPGDQRGRNEQALSLNIDFAPTFLDLAGLEPPDRMQGRSLLPVLEGQIPDGWRDDFFYEHHFSAHVLPASEGVRTARWTYIRWINEDPLIEELFDTDADPLQGTNLAADPKHASTLEALRARWESFSRTLP